MRSLRIVAGLALALTTTTAFAMGGPVPTFGCGDTNPYTACLFDNSMRLMTDSKGNLVPYSDADTQEPIELAFGGAITASGGPRGEDTRGLMAGIGRVQSGYCSACNAAWGSIGGGSGSTTSRNGLGSGPSYGGGGNDPSGMGIGGGVQGNDANDVSGNSVGY